MSHDSILLTIRARLQAPDKSYIPGVLTVHGTRVSWQALDIHAAAPVSYLAAGITNTQKAKGKPFLRLAAGKAASVFEFDSEPERERAVMEISGIMQSGGGGGGEAARDADIAGLSRQQRTAILKEQPDTAMLFNDLVGSGSLTDSEFWIKYTQTHPMPDRTSLVSSQTARGGASSGSGPTEQLTQHVGMQNAMLQVKATSVNNTLTIKISEPDKQAVFHEKPHVLRAYQANVPGNMSEEEFWRRFYLHEEGKKARRKAANEVGHVQYHMEEGIFREKGGGAAAAAASREKLRRLNPAINLIAQSGEAYSGFGLAHRESAIPTALADATEQLARDINRHAEVVLQGVRSLQQPTNAAPGGSSSSNYIKNEEELGEMGPVTRAEGAGLDDLSAVHAAVTESLDIRDPRRYFETTATESEQDRSGRGNKAASEKCVLQPSLLSCTSGTRLCNPLLPPMLAEQILWEATPATRVLGDVDHYGVPTRPPQEALLPDVVAVQRNFVLQANELSRHFWGTIPATTAAKLEKAERLTRSMEVLKGKVHTSIDMVSGPERAYIRQLVRPALDAVEAAFARFDQDVLLSASNGVQ